MSCEEAIWSGMHGDVTGDQLWELFSPSCSVWLIRFPQIAGQGREGSSALGGRGRVRCRLLTCPSGYSE